MAKDFRMGLNQYFEALRGISDGSNSNDPIFIYGGSDFLRQYALNTLKKIARSHDVMINDYLAAELDVKSLQEAINQDGLFSAKKMILVQQLDKNTTLLMKGNFHTHIGNSCLLVMAYHQDKIAASLKKSIETDSWRIIPALQPGPKDLPLFIKVFAKEKGLQFAPEVYDFLIESLGSDLYKISNEINMLSLIFPDSSQANRLTVSQVQDALGYLRDDHAFRLEEFLLEKAKGKVLNLLSDLIRRGESPLAILGVLSHHCRKAIQILSAQQKGTPLPIISSTLRLPAFVIRKFLSALNVNDLSRYDRALRLCQEADMMFKSSKISEQIIFSQIILTLMN